MAITNENKPPSGSQYHLDVGSSYGLNVGSGFLLAINTLGALFTNTSKVSVGETWGTVTTTWASETRTWLAVSQLITNTAVSSTLPLWNLRTFPWQEALPWQNTNVGLTNVNKP